MLSADLWFDTLIASAVRHNTPAWGNGCFTWLQTTVTGSARSLAWLEFWDSSSDHPLLPRPKPLTSRFLLSLENRHQGIF